MSNVKYVYQKRALKLEKKEREIEAMEGCSDQQIAELKEQLRKSHEDQIKQVIEMVFSWIYCLHDIFVFTSSS